MESSTDFVADFASPCGQYTLTFDDDGRVAYAYLKRDVDIVADVWIYNRCPTPETPEWGNRSLAPFANCKGFTRPEGYFVRAVALNDLKVEWEYLEREPIVRLYLFAELVAIIGFGDKPGCSRFAAKDGPLAKVLI